MPPRRYSSATSGSDTRSSGSSPLSTTEATLHPSDSVDPPSTRRNSQARSHPELSRSFSTGRGGCWTCRLRRKKCDEQRVGDSCKTCLRLEIRCLGWDIRRPDWMRDKQKVQEYRAEITDKLRRANKIRGQPRSTYVQSTPQHATQAAPRPNGRARPKPIIEAPKVQDLDWSTPESLTPSAYQAVSTPPSSGSNTPHSTGNPSLGYHDQPLSNLDLPHSVMLPYPQTTSSVSPDSQSNIPYYEFDPQQQDPAALPYQIGSSQVDQQSSDERSELILYFFHHVKSRQFKFSRDPNNVTDVIFSIIVEEPRGALANAICALASLHQTRMCQASGYVPADPNLNLSAGQALYDQALYQLRHARQLGYTDKDAVAALNLTSFGVFSDGWTDWADTLQIASDWLAESGLLAEQNPRLSILNMNIIGSFAIKLTIWLDVFASITKMEPPRFMDLYHRLFGEGNDFSGSLQMEQVTGFTEDVLYAIAQTSTLARWKSTEIFNGRLSVRELIRRGDAIEQMLRRSEQGQRGLNSNELNIDFTAQGALSALAEDDMNEQTRFLVRRLFREAAILYLHTVLSDPNPAVHEIRTGVDSIIQLMKQLPPSPLDQALVFPICLAGCMTDDVVQRQYLISRTQQPGFIGNILQTRSTMESVWRKRDTLRQNGAPAWQNIEWRESLHDQGSNLLLI